MKVKFLAVLTAALVASPAAAQVLFSDDLSDGTGWGVNAFGDGDHLATFGYDYSVDAIPEAPNNLGGTATTGVKLEANIVDPGAAAGFTIYPIGQSFSGEYQLRFDAWMNYDLDTRLNGGAAGTTEFIGGGIGYDSTTPDIGVGAQLIATGEGGSGSDWRAFADGTFLANEDMVAGSRNGFVPYYADFLPGVPAPAGQFQLETGPGVAGSPGFQWITFEINTANGKSRMLIEKPGGDQLIITNIDLPYTSDGNIGIYYADLFSSVTTSPFYTFGIVDNVVVTQIPEPTTAGLAAITLAGVAARRRRLG
ncbi:MAG: PEP-CTERM sorting domain-containing protein [Planctomycetota bacterium]